jgi:hypothetical protein
MLHSRTQLLALALVLACAGAAHADFAWQVGDEITYDEGAWSSIAGAVSLLVADYASVYAPTGVVTVGLPITGFTMRFDGPTPILFYLPASGPLGVLTSNVLDPIMTSAGFFGGDVLALQLNVDFNNAGFLVGGSGIPLGDLVLQNFSTLPALNGLLVSQFLADANRCVGGGSCLYDANTMDTVAAEITDAFAEGTPSSFAQTSLARPTVSAVPEPSSLLLLLTVVAGLAWTRGWFRRSARRSS